MDFTKLDGFEFEKLIGILLNKMGFVVEETVLTGDEGIDIIAYDFRPIFKGKYIVQCKNWDSPVGQPPIRDLYGVVMSENANKGILITTSTFTKQARTFADNKNLELIDKDDLLGLFNNYDMTELSLNNLKGSKINFYDLKGFNKQKYMYLKDKVNNNRNEKSVYYALKNFYHEYLLKNQYDICINGLFDEYIELNNEIIKRFCKRSKKDLCTKNSLRYLNAIIFILKGELFKAIDELNDLGIFSIKDIDINYLATNYRSELLFVIKKDKLEKIEVIVDDSAIYKDDGTSIKVIFKNLYIIFSYLNFECGMQFIEKIIDESIKKLRRSDWYNDSKLINKDFITLSELQIKNVLREFKEIKDKKNGKYHIPIDFEYCKCGWSNNYKIIAKYKEDVYIKIEDILSVFWNNCNIDEEIEKIKLMISNNVLE